MYVTYLLNVYLFCQIKLIRVKSDEFFESFDASADLYKKYQMAIHGESAEECDESFLCFFVRHTLEVHFVFKQFLYLIKFMIRKWVLLNFMEVMYDVIDIHYQY